MKKILLGTLVAIALLTGCTEEKKAPATQTPTAEVKKEETVTPTAEVKKEETVTPATTQTENK
jgi:uncharacterized lipoprotein YajG